MNDATRLNFSVIVVGRNDVDILIPRQALLLSNNFLKLLISILDLFAPFRMTVLITYLYDLKIFVLIDFFAVV